MGGRKATQESFDRATGEEIGIYADASRVTVIPYLPSEVTMVVDDALKRWICLGCGFSYDEALGLPEHGIQAGTRWRDVPEDWVCPDCGTPKSRFEMVEIPYAEGQPAPRAAA